MTTTTDDRCTLVLDIGKSNARLVLIDAAGEVVARRSQASAGRHDAALDATVLDVERLQAWLRRDIAGLPAEQRARIDRLSITTHGAAFCGLSGDGPDAQLALAPIDYEWDGYDAEFLAAERAEADPFEHTGSPALPMGLNAGRPLRWVQTRHPALWARARVWLPYAQYWAWWFSGVACSEVSSLGCHTGLWSPAERGPSAWARRTGLAERLAPLRAAWETVGRVRPALAAALGLPEGVRVLAGSHDSNACLARHLATAADATVVSTGTWCIVMAPGAPIDGLDAARDQLVNIAVDGRPVPTGRFMGGREFAAICGDSDPAWATVPALREVLAQGWTALPAFAEAGGPFVGQRGRVLRHGQPVEAGLAAVPAALRPALAALYCALMLAWMVEHLAAGARAGAPVLLEGPLATNPAHVAALAALLAPRPLQVSTDPLEGTARGAWMLAHWPASPHAPTAQPVRPTADLQLAPALQALARQWQRHSELNRVESATTG